MQPRVETPIFRLVLSRIALLSLVVLALGACETPISVAVDFDPDARLDEFTTYAWISSETLIPQVDGVTRGGPRISPIDDSRIRRAVDVRLAAKGWKRAPKEEADLVVSYGIGAEEKTELYETVGGYRGYLGYGYGYGGWYAHSSVHAKKYTEGTLTLEFFDRRTKQAAWVGWASKRMSERDERGVVIERSVEMILLDFPSRS
jgi:hypothetical protein